MKRILFTLLAVLLFSTTAGAVELLVQAVDSKYETGAKIGDVIIVRPDGWEWGKEECLPRYVIVKLPGVKEADAKKYEEQLTEEVTKEIDGKSITEQKMIRKRKYKIPATDVSIIKASKSSVLSVSSKDVSAYQVTAKTLSVEKAAIENAEQAR